MPPQAASKRRKRSVPGTGRFPTFLPRTPAKGPQPFAIPHCSLDASAPTLDEPLGPIHPTPQPLLPSPPHLACPYLTLRFSLQKSESPPGCKPAEIIGWLP